MKVSDKKDTTILKKPGSKREELLKRKMANPEHVREIGKQSFRKLKERRESRTHQVN